MKSNRLFLSRSYTATTALLISVAWLTCSTFAQNYLKNGDFEEPFGPDNWSVEYTGVANPITVSVPATCGPNDFEVQGRTRIAHRDKVGGAWDGVGGPNHYWSKMGGHFRAGHDWIMHGYFKQVVTGLQPGSNYVISCYMAMIDAVTKKAQIYLEALGGPNRTTSISFPSATDLAAQFYITNDVWNNPTNWAHCVVTNTASNAGEIEVRLHYNKNGSTSAEKWRNMDALYDHASVVPAWTQTPQPPFTLSLNQAGQNSTFSWDTVMNNTYRIQVSTNLADSGSWYTFLGPYPWQDPDFMATGANYTFTTNILANSVGNPNYNTNMPLFFRVFAQEYNPAPWP